MIICLNMEKFDKLIYYSKSWCSQMAEASLAAFGSAIGVAVAMAVVCFALRGKGHHESLE